MGPTREYIHVQWIEMSQYRHFVFEFTPLSVLPFLYSVNLTEYVAMDPRVCVCLCVCVSHLYSPNGRTNFDETLHKSFSMNLLNTFFSDFENSNLMTSWRPF